MTTIWKFPLQLNADVQVLGIPQPAILLTCQLLDGGPCLWALVDPEARTETVTIHIIKTGRSVPDGLTYLATLQLAGGALVYHVFVETVRTTDG